MNSFNKIESLMQVAINHININTDYLPIVALLFDNQYNILDIQKNTKEDHAECLIKTNINNNLNNLNLIVTLEPCPMCLFKIYNTSILNLFFGAFNPQYGACGGCFHLQNQIKISRKLNIFGGILEKQNSEILKHFFIQLR